VLLVSGLGSQLIGWEDGFCGELVDRGLYVIRFDNRDVGLSTHLADSSAGAPGPVPGLPAPAYMLSDLAADAAGLVDVLGLGSVHVVGASMGGMISQLLAIEHPDSVRSLTSIMSTTGDPAVGEASDEALALLLAPPAVTRDAVQDGAVLAHSVLGSPAYPTPEDVLRERAGRAYDRAFDPGGVARQLTACLVTPDRTEQLGQLDVPALVIHGDADALIGVSGGRATAAAIPGAELVVIDGMGHDVPPGLWSRVADLVATLVERVET
jgi:pimeloyl-ACP methyl ester carboxylesterase